MPSRKKIFPCGHRGSGRYCHRCKQAESTREALRADKDEWERRVAGAPVAVAQLPRQVAEEALRVMDELEGGTPYRAFMGKRLKTMGQRHIVSIPLRSSYRLICRDEDGRLRPLEVLSHEAYSTRIGAGGWS